MIVLRKMKTEEFETYRQFSFDNFLNESAKAAGQDPEVLRAKLGGPPTKIGKNDIWLVIDLNGGNVGFIWMQLQPDKKLAIGYDIYINEKFRSKGIGREVMLQCGDYLRNLNISRIEICVYQHNNIARSLYSSLGFKETKFDSERGQHYLEMQI